MNEWVKRFILGASLILFAGVVFYVVAPKWQYTVTAGGVLSHKYNSITGNVWAVEDEDRIGKEEKGIARIAKVSFASSPLEYGKMKKKMKDWKEEDPREKELLSGGVGFWATVASLFYEAKLEKGRIAALSAHKAAIEKSESVSVEDFLKEGEKNQ